jgi:hypothetical protein
MNNIENGAISKPDGSDNRTSLKYLERTSGSDKQFIASMLQSFIKNNTFTFVCLTKPWKRNDYNAIHDLHIR